MKVLIVAGGTGGHIYPGISVAQQLLKKHHEVTMVIRDTAKEKEITSYYKIPVRTLPGVGLKKTLGGLLSFIYNFILGLRESLRILREVNPDVILAMGNYLSLSMGLAGYWRRKPLILHEQNCLPGKSTKFLARFARKVCISFAETEPLLKKYKKDVILTGNPLRTEIQGSVPSKKNRSILTLLVFGGSQGAHSINRAMVEALDYLEDIRTKIAIIHISGERDSNFVQEGYREKNFQVTIAPYIEAMHEVYAQSHLVVSRAGALTLTEIAHFGLPSILIPYPYAAENHQFINAEQFERADAAVIIEDKNLTGESLADTIKRLCGDVNLLKTMGDKAKKLSIPNSSEKIVGILESCACKRC